MKQDRVRTDVLDIAFEEHGPSQFAFTFKTVQPPDETFLAALDWSLFTPCPAMS